jgi:hypothetical protein
MIIWMGGRRSNSGRPRSREVCLFTRGEKKRGRRGIKSIRERENDRLIYMERNRTETFGMWDGGKDSRSNNDVGELTTSIPVTSIHLP